MKNTIHNTIGRIAAAILALAIAFTGISLDGTITANAATKCAHKWKITRKATCKQKGVKTCKLCKLQTSINRTGHKWAK